MSKLSEKKIEKIKNDVLFVLFENNLKPLYTKHIADELARDDEFVLRLLKGLEKNNLIKQVNKKDLRRKRWVIGDEAYKKYKELLPV